MRDLIDGTASRPSSLRYLPATLAAGALLASLLLAPAASQWASPWCYGAFLKGKGAPPPSRSTLLVASEGATGGSRGSLDDTSLLQLVKALLEMRPAVLALDLPDGKTVAAWAAIEGSLPQGPVVIGLPFKAFHPWSLSEAAVVPYPPLLARSLYPFLDGPAVGDLKLPMGEGLEWPDSLRWPGASLGFSGPMPQGVVWGVPAFARLGRGVAGSLGVEAARRALGQPPEKVGYVDGLGVVFDPTHMLPLDERGQALIRLHPDGGIPRLSARQILEGNVRREDVQGKAVFVDNASGPLMRTPQGPRSAAELWANAADNVLEGTAISTPTWSRALSVAVGIAFAALVAVALTLELSAFSTFCLGGLLFAAYPALSFWFFLQSSWWLPPELPPLMVLASYLPFVFVRMMSPKPMAVPFSAPPHPQVSPGYLPPMPPISPTPMHGMPQLGPMAQAVPTREAAPAYTTMPPVPPLPSTSRPRDGAPRENPYPSGPIPLTSPRAPEPPRGQPYPSGPIPLIDHAAKPRPPVPRERQGSVAEPIPPSHAAAARLAAAPSQNATPVLPAMSPPRPAAAQPAPRPQETSRLQEGMRPPEGPAGQHTGSISDEIERDAKGGLVRVGKYRIVRKMGFGSGGDVFEGFDTHMGRKVAIKTITKDAALHFDRAAERFQLEAKAAGSLNHPCINTIYDFGSIREVSYMVLEYLDGITLSQWMKNNPIPTPVAAGHWVQQMCSALDFAHGNRVIHRDLKPSNLMIVNGGATIKLLDFGIAKMEDVMLTQTGMTVGTPSYMSPEQLTGAKVGPASDQYGLAVVIYQIFTYKLPYLGTKIPELCNRILKNEIVPITDANPTLSPAFWEALRKAMAKAPEDRYPNCMAMYQALEATFPSIKAAPAPT